MKTIRPYNPETDREAVQAIWREVGWLEKDQNKPMDLMFDASRAMVSDLRGNAECLVITSSASMRYLDADLPLTAVTGVTTSRIARKRGIARKTLTHALIRDVEDGAILAGLSMFDQGYYELLGFGTGGYEVWVDFDPSTLSVPAHVRSPIRLGKADGERMHAARLARLRGHGSVNFDHPAITTAELEWAKNGFGLGYEEDGDLSHFIFCDAEDVEYGPYTVWFSAYRDHQQFLELLSLLKSLGDQIHKVTMRQPPAVQMQDFLNRPFRLRRKTEKGKFSNRLRASAYWQMRILDLPACLEKTHLSCPTLRFNLSLSDPLETLLPANATWRGCGGDYIVEIGAESSAQPGHDPSLPLLTASVGALTRLWLGVLPASSLVVSDHLSGPAALLRALDKAFRLPPPHPDWEY